jgi:hypothetical protein
LRAQLLELALEHPNCSALQATALRILRASLVSPAPGLWLPLVEKSRGDCEDPVPLQSSLAKVRQHIYLRSTAYAGVNTCSVGLFRILFEME